MILLEAFLDELLTVGEAKEVFFAIRSDSAPGSGTKEDPYNGSTDEVLYGVLRDPEKITEGMDLNFGPGVFQTKGGGGAAPGWTPLSRQRIRGAGMFQTTLQLVKAAPIIKQGQFVGTPVGAINSALLPIDGVEISNMTIDANIDRQPRAPGGGPTLISVGAIGLSKASNCRVRRAAGALLRAHDGTRYKLELADEVQDVLLASGSSTWRL